VYDICDPHWDYDMSKYLMMTTFPNADPMWPPRKSLKLSQQAQLVGDQSAIQWLLNLNLGKWPFGMCQTNNPQCNGVGDLQ